MVFGNNLPAFRALPLSSVASVLIGVVGASLLCAAPVQAQIFQVTPAPQVTQTPATTATPAAKKPVKQAKQFRLEKVLADMQRCEAEARRTGVVGSSGDGFLLIAESSVAQNPVTVPKDVTTAATIEAQLDALVKDLPHGTRWVKLMLPPVPPGKTLHGDDLADFALAQARIYGSVGEATLPPGSVEVLSQPLGKDKANAVVPALNLRPVYLVVNPDAHYAMVRGGGAQDTSWNLLLNSALLRSGDNGAVQLYLAQPSDLNTNGRTSSEWSTIFNVLAVPSAPSTPNPDSGGGAGKP